MLKKQTGYTLTEVMVVVAILGIIVGGASIILTNFTRYWRLNLARTEIQRDARRIMSLMDRTIRQGQQSTIVIDQLTVEPPWSRITFTTISGNSISYYQKNGKIYQTVNSKTVMLAENLRTLRFTYPNTDDGTILGVSVCFEKATYESRTKALQLSIEKVRVMND
ncbi:MAG: prepilin-type N-terminal cleavage/methylation domain-containing protein [Candidatus Firestonebacteria bacterium]